MLANHPDKRGRKVLHIRRADENPSDGAVWNFPAGRQGVLDVRIRLNPGFGGARISLADCFMFPTDTVGDEEHALAAIDISPAGDVAENAAVKPGDWHTLSFRWDLDKSTDCRVLLDGQPFATIPVKNAKTNGISYLRLRSTATETDAHGFFVERVSMRWK